MIEFYNIWHITGQALVSLIQTSHLYQQYSYNILLDSQPHSHNHHGSGEFIQKYIVDKCIEIQLLVRLHFHWS